MGNQNNQQAGGSKMVKGLLIGGAVGVTAAMLMTPKSGKDMRDTIRRKSSELTTSAREKAGALAAHAKDKASDVSDRVNEMGRTAASKVATAAETTANVLQSMKREEGANPHGATNGAASGATASERS